jgi:hypothetical protein
LTAPKPIQEQPKPEKTKKLKNVVIQDSEGEPTMVSPKRVKKTVSQLKKEKVEIDNIPDRVTLQVRPL